MAKKMKTSIGGQALIEGIMMQGPDKRAIVVRSPEGLVTKIEPYKPLKERCKLLGWPIIRGCAALFTSLYHGVKALTFSAEYFPEEETEPEKQSKLDKWLEKKLSGEKAEKAVTYFGVCLGVVLAVLLFFMLPTFVAGLVGKNISSAILKNLIEGIIRIVIFLCYMFLCSRMGDIKRVFSYHGAEHKTIFCYEAGEELTVENVRKYSCHHPRCGTSFLFVVMIISILVFAVVSWSNVFIRMALRIVLLPVVVGISYEINRFVGRHDNILTKILTAPGLALQNLTTFEPDDSMIEVGIEALKLVIPEQEGADKW
ncbi:MAG: DUF1385 domain-containing protein [Oscillospiraceae bacterium]|nr:DUF1385 domain-containing protein [Oscillospiraceae bacterium]